MAAAESPDGDAPDGEDTLPDYLYCDDFWDHFYSNIEKIETEHGTCHTWTASTLSGYGLFNISDYTDSELKVFAHRLIAERETGRPLQKHEQVHHECCMDDNGGTRACVNPEHLTVLTVQEHWETHARENAENTDAGPWEGENNPAHKLNADQVIALRKEYHLNRTDLTEIVQVLDVEVDYDTAWSALHGHTWSHIDAGIPEDERRSLDYAPIPDDVIEYILRQYHEEEQKSLTALSDELNVCIDHLSGIVNRERRTDVEVELETTRNAYAGEAHYNSKLRDSDIPEILERRWIDGETYASISKDYPPSEQRIGNICRRRGWEHVPIPDHILPHMPEPYRKYPNGKDVK